MSAKLTDKELSYALDAVYRINAYDYVDGQYIVVNGLNNGNTFETFNVSDVLNSNW